MIADIGVKRHAVQDKLTSGFENSKSENKGNFSVQFPCWEVMNALAASEYEEKLSIEFFPSFQICIKSAAVLFCIT